VLQQDTNTSENHAAYIFRVKCVVPESGVGGGTRKGKDMASQ